MPTVTAIHTHTFGDGKPVTKECTLSFGTYDDPNLKRERESTFTHPDTGETHTHRFIMTKTSKNNHHTWSDDTDGGYESDDVSRYRKY